MTVPPDGLVTTEQAAEILGIPASTIRSWKRRKRITEVDYTPGRGRQRRSPLYRLDVLRELAEGATTTRRQGPDQR